VQKIFFAKNPESQCNRAGQNIVLWEII